MIHTHTKFAPLGFINKKMKGKRRFFYPNRTSPLCVIGLKMTILQWFEFLHVKTRKQTNFVIKLICINCNTNFLFWGRIYKVIEHCAKLGLNTLTNSKVTGGVQNPPPPPPPYVHQKFLFPMWNRVKSPLEELLIF